MADAKQGSFVGNQLVLQKGTPAPPPAGSVALITTDGTTPLLQQSDGSTSSIGGGGGGLPSGTGLVRVDSGTGSVDAAATSLVTTLEGRWENVQQAFLNSKISGLTYEYAKIGGAANLPAGGLAAVTGDALVEGGGISGVAAGGYRQLGSSVYQAMKTKKWAWCFRAKLPINGAHDYEFGFYGTVGGHYVVIQALNTSDATHICLQFANGSATKTVTTFVADSLWHDFACTFDPGAGTPTVSVYVDGNLVGTQTTLTNLGDFASYPAIYCDDGSNTAAVSKLIYGYVNPT